MAVAIEAIPAIIGALTPLIVLWYISQHLQDVNAELQKLAQLPGISIASAEVPLVVGALVLTGGVAAIAIGFYVAEKRIGGEHVHAPEFAPIQTPQLNVGYQTSQNVGYTGRGFNFGQGGSGGGTIGGGATRTSRPRTSRRGSFGRGRR